MTSEKEAVLPIFRPLSLTRSSTFQENCDVLIADSDSLAFLKTIPDNAIRLVVSSPPYNIGKPYEERTTLDDYLQWQLSVLKECNRILHPEGSLCWEVGNHIHDGEIFPLDTYFYRLIKDDLGMKLRNRIIWSFEHGLHARKRFSGRYEVILWFTKGDSYIFNLDPVRIPQKYPGKRYFKGPNQGQLSGNPLGKNPGDIWKLLLCEWEEQIWDIPNVKANHPEKLNIPLNIPLS